MGAVASGGIVLVDPALAGQVPEETFRGALERAVRELNERERLYRGVRPPAQVEGRTIVLVDDGLATGATMRAAVEAIRRRRPTTDDEVRHILASAGSSREVGAEGAP
jgi:predicted phosphoribosyltransferase